jgi:ATP-binding cassette subfamily B protein
VNSTVIADTHGPFNSSSDDEENGRYEPVDVEARYENPRASVDPDVTKNWLMRFLPVFMVNIWPFSIGIALSIVSMMFSVATPALTGKLIDSITPAVVDGATDAFFLLIAILGLVAVLRTITSFFNSYLLQRVSNQLESDLRSLIYNHLVTLSFSFYDKTQTGQVISRANSDIRAIQMLLMMTPMVLTSVLSFFLAIGYMLTVSVSLTLSALIAVPGVYVLSMRLRKIMFPLSWITQARQADVAVIVDENVNGQRVVKAFAQEEHQLNMLARAAKRLQWVQVKSIDIQSIYGPVIENLTTVGQVLVWVYGGWLVIQGEVLLGSLVAFNMYVMMIQAPFRMLGWLLQMEQRAKASADRIYEILDTKPEIVDRDKVVHLSNPEGHVSFENVKFSYNDEVVLRDVSFDVKAGETVAIVGRTGSGKSTIVRLLSRFYNLDDGCIRIDNIDSRDLSIKSLHYHVGQVLDEPFLFSISIRQNIAYGRPAALLDDVVNAAKAAHAHDFIMALPEGYDSIVGERGYTLSGGQRQRLGIARALLLNPPILVLDDATSAIDVKIEAEIHTALLQLMKNRTTIVIAHRLSTISLAERVLFLDKGKIAASGTHQQLMLTTPEYRDVLAQQGKMTQEGGENGEVDERADHTQEQDESDSEYRKRIAAIAAGTSSRMETVNPGDLIS